MISIVVGVVLLYCCLQAFSIYRLFLHRRERIALTPPPQEIGSPGISVITSLKGETDGLAPGLECLRKQTYRGPLEIILVIQDPQDPALEAARRIVFAWPSNERALVKWVTGFTPTGLNPRCAKMNEGFKHAKHDWLYWHAIDTVIRPEHLATAMQLANQDQDRFVTSFPVNINSRSLGARLESVCLNLEVTKFFILTFAQPGGATAYGGSMLFHRALLLRSGGLTATLNRLTDDVILTKQFLRAGARCILSPLLVYVPQDSMSLKDYFKRQVRWMMIARYYMPEVYFISPLFWVGQVLILTGCARQSADLIWLGAGIFLLRVFQALVFEILLGGPVNDWLNVILLPVYDFLLPLIWFLAMTVRKLNWAGDIMIVGSGGVLRPVATKPK